MKTLVLSKFSMGKTGRKIAKALGADYNYKVPMHYAEYDRLVRWGVSYAPEIDAEIDTVLNSATSIRTMSNRLLMLKHFNANYIPTMVWTDHYCLRSEFGMWGNDIKLPNQFVVHKWLADFEVRLHIVNGISVCMQIKRQKHEDTNKPKREWFIRNRQNGWHLYHLHNDEAERLEIDKAALRVLAKRTIDSAQLSFGVVDFLVRPNQYKILEVNTAPGLEDATITRYVEHLNA